MDRVKRFFGRRFFQLIALVGSNSYFQGFVNKTIYKGSTKAVCVPFMNCYSCPGARFSCPIGSLQAVLGKKGNYVSLYVVGFLVLIGILVGRLICGFLCPVGFIQDMLAKITKKKYKVYKPLKGIKYVLLVVTVILLPMFLTDSVGLGTPYFCKYVCPVGTLEGGIFLVAVNSALRSTIGFLYHYKLTILIGVLVTSVVVYRPFCKIFCPLGALYGLFNKISFLRMTHDSISCVSCGKCERTCKMEVVPYENPNSTECIRCGECVKECPKNALSLGIKFNLKEGEKNELRKI